MLFKQEADISQLIDKYNKSWDFLSNIDQYYLSLYGLICYFYPSLYRTERDLKQIYDQIEESYQKLTESLSFGSTEQMVLRMLLVREVISLERILRLSLREEGRLFVHPDNSGKEQYNYDEAVSFIFSRTRKIVRYMNDGREPPEYIKKILTELPEINIEDVIKQLEAQGGKVYLDMPPEDES